MLQSKHRVTEWIQKQHPYICCLQETCLRCTETHTESGGDGKRYPCKWKQNESWGSNT